MKYLILLAILVGGCSYQETTLHHDIPKPKFKAGDCVTIKETNFYSGVCKILQIKDFGIKGTLDEIVYKGNGDPEVESDCPGELVVKESELGNKVKCPDRDPNLIHIISPR